jgi:hypothetical protein
METQKRHAWVWVLLVAFAAGVILAPLLLQCGAPSAPTPAEPTPLPPNAIGISIVTNDTKAEWLGQVTEVFNKSAVKTTQGHQIVVQMI